MVTCRYIGSNASVVGEREFDAVGQVANFSEAEFADIIRGNAPFIVEQQFNRLGFSAEELSEHGPMGSRDNPPASFNDKLALGQQFFREIRSRLQSGEHVHNVLAYLN